MMKKAMKKILATALLLALTITFTSCSLDELNFMNTMNTMQSLTEVKFEGSIKLNINELSENENYVEVTPTPTPVIDAQVNGYSVAKKQGMKLLKKLQSETPLLDAVIDDDLILDDPQDAMTLIMESISEMSGSSLVYSGSISKINNKLSLNISTMDSEKIVAPIINLIFNDKTLLINKEFLDLYYIEYTDEETIDEVDYGKLLIDDLIESYFEPMKENYKDIPQSYPSYNIPDDSSDEYFSGYMDGFDIGMNDGYYETVTQTPTEGEADYLTGYDVGYAEGFTEGENDKSAYNLNKDHYADVLGDIEEQQTKLSANLNSANIIKIITRANNESFNEVFNVFFQNFSLGLVKKDGNSKYTIDMNFDQMIDALSETLLYMMDNFDQFKTLLATLIENSFNEDVMMIMPDSSIKDIMIDIVDELEAPPAQDLEKEKTDMLLEMDKLKTEMAKAMSINFKYSLEKTGSVSYDSNSVISMKTLADDTSLPFVMDMDILFDMSVNKSGDGDIKVLENVSVKSDDNASIKLDVNDENVVEAGIYYSNDKDFTNPIMLKAIKQEDGSYVVDMSELDPTNTYYYKSYTKDEFGNLVFSSAIKTFNTAMSPATGDTASPWPIVIFVVAAILIAGALLILKKKTK